MSKEKRHTCLLWLNLPIMFAGDVNHSLTCLHEAVRAQQHQVQESMIRQKSSEQLQSRSERENATQQRNFIKTRLRSQSNVE